MSKSDAELQEGKRYAWAVQALGENSEFNRRNTNGRSSINIFSFVKEAEAEKRQATEKEERRKREKDEKDAKEKLEKEEKELRGKRR